MPLIRDALYALKLSSTLMQDAYLKKDITRVEYTTLTLHIENK